MVSRSGVGEMPLWASYRLPRMRGAKIPAKDRSVIAAMATSRRKLGRGAMQIPKRYAAIAGA